MSKTIAQSWRFESSSSGKLYETLRYTDGSTSCDCPGWTRRCVNGVRTCKHTRAVECGTADRECVSTSQPPAVNVQWPSGDDYDRRIAQLEAEGCTTSDAQGIIEVECRRGVFHANLQRGSLTPKPAAPLPPPKARTFGSTARKIA
jgi:hypothetical protein